jgi:hypothetical protein
LRKVFPGVKRLEFEADHLPLSSAEVKNEWSSTSSPLYAFLRSTVPDLDEENNGGVFTGKDFALGSVAEFF